MNSKNHVTKFISWFMSIVFILLGFPLKSEAKKAKDRDIDTNRSLYTGIKFIYQKNNDGENTKTLLSVVSPSGTKDIKISGWNNVTRVADKFSSHLDIGQSMEDSFFETLCNNTKVFFRNMRLGFLEVCCMLAPFFNLFYAAGRENVGVKSMLGSDYESFEPYKKKIKDIDLVTEIDLPNCLEIGKEAFCYYSKLKRVNLPKCERIGVNAFASLGAIEEMCVSKNIDLQSSSTVKTLQQVLDKGAVLKCVDANGKAVQVRSLSEFPNFNKSQQI